MLADISARASLLGDRLCRDQLKARARQIAARQGRHILRGAVQPIDAKASVVVILDHDHKRCADMLEGGMEREALYGQCP